VDIDLHVEGPFEVLFSSEGRAKEITATEVQAFWAKRKVSHLKTKRGCYIFAKRASKGFTPWYVGKAGAKGGFEQEVFKPDKIQKYNSALNHKSKGNPVLFFVSRTGNRNVIPTAELNNMEKVLIQFAKNKNPALKNVQHTKNAPRWRINGVIRSGQGRSSKTADVFTKMMKIR